MANDNAKGVLLFCHGARAASWRVPFDALLTSCRQDCPDLPTELAFLEFMQPDFASAVEGLVAKGAQEINVVLLFLAAGGHTLNDVSALVASAQQAHQGLRITVSNTLLESAIMQSACRQWIRELLP